MSAPSAPSPEGDLSPEGDQSPDQELATDHLTQDLGGNMGIEGGRLELLVAEQHLDHADIHLLFEQVGGEAVPQRMHRDLLVDAGREPGLVHGAVQLACSATI